MPQPKKVKPKGEYRNLDKRDGLWYFEVRVKSGTWLLLGGLSGDTSREDAEKFAQNTAEGFKKR